MYGTQKIIIDCANDVQQSNSENIGLLAGGLKEYDFPLICEQNSKEVYQSLEKQIFHNTLTMVSTIPIDNMARRGALLAKNIWKINLSKIFDSKDKIS